MKITDLKKRLAKDRPMTTISIRMPEDIIEDLKRIAPLLGFSGYQPLIRAYIGKGLREDVARLEVEKLPALVENPETPGRFGRGNCGGCGRIEGSLSHQQGKTE